MALLSSLKGAIAQLRILQIPPIQSITKPVPFTSFPCNNTHLSIIRPAMQTQIRPQSTSTILDEERYWSHIPRWADISADQFINWEWQRKQTVSMQKVPRLLSEVLPDTLAPSKSFPHIKTKEDFLREVEEGLKKAPMTVRLTPHLVSLIDWNSPLDDPLRRQFIPIRSGILPDHPQLTFDSLGEQHDQVVPGLIHRYPGKALFLPISVCPVYCRFCTRSWAVGADTELRKKESQKPTLDRWEKVFQHIKNDTSLQDIVVSGGDAYQLPPESIRMIGDRLLSIPHLRRFRFASKGLAVAPGRVLDRTDPWIDEIVALSNRGRQIGKQVCIHTHFNHPREITWITHKAANYLFEQGVIVRNQSVLLKGINDDVKTMGTLIKALGDMNIQPYYVYQCDLVRGIEDLRTPLRTILELEKHIRGTFTGFMIPNFVVDLPGGGGKRLASTYEKYDEANGLSYWSAPGLPGKKGKEFYAYYDPYPDTQTIHARQQKLVAETIAHMYEQSPEHNDLVHSEDMEKEEMTSAPGCSAFASALEKMDAREPFRRKRDESSDSLRAKTERVELSQAHTKMRQELARNIESDMNTVPNEGEGRGPIEQIVNLSTEVLEQQTATRSL